MTTSSKITKDIDAYFYQWQEINKHMQQILIPVQKQQEELLGIIQPFLEAQTALHESFEPILTAQEEWRTIISSFELPQNLMPDLTPMTEQALLFSKSLEGIISPVFERLQRSFDDLPQKTQEALLLLGMNGWYLDLDMPIASLWELKKALQDGNNQEAEETLGRYFEERLDEIEASIIERFPTREKIVRASFSAHRRGEYELSIPVLLSQTDGICKDVVKEHFFRKVNKKPRTAIYVEQIAADTYRAAILSPLAQNLPIVMSEEERGTNFTELNRHMVLHGESLDYGTKINSLKAISLINYVANVLNPNEIES